jgi:hypothetical protein
MLIVMNDMDPSHNYLGSGWFESGWFGSWYAVGAKPVGMVLGLATGGMPTSVGQFWPQV